MMKNKKAWIRILEAVIAVLLVASIVVVLYVRQSGKIDKGEEIYRIQRGILDEIAANDSLRVAVLNNNTLKVEQFVIDRIPPGFDVRVLICEPQAICALGTYIGEEGKEIYSTERLISSVLTDFAPKKLKIFMYER